MGMAQGLGHLQIHKKIIHVDMDCFFAAVEELDDPSLKNKPMAVGGSPTGRGVLCTANYKAREYGVRSAMSSSEALRKCPHLIFRRPRSFRYKEFALIIREVFHEITPLVQPLSLDEAYLDVTNSTLFNGSATLIAKYIKQEIFKRTGLTASAGVAGNKFLAKVGSDWNKPDGLTIIPPEEAYSFASALPIRLVPGIGQVTEKRCHDLGITELGDLQHYPLSWLESKFGSFAESLYLKSFGIDNRPVTPESMRKSIGHEETYSNDLGHRDEILDQLPFLVEEVIERFQRQVEKKPMTPAPHKIFVKCKTSQFKNHSFECLIKNTDLTFKTPQELKDQSTQFSKHTASMMMELYDRIGNVPLRLLGLGLRFPEVQDGEAENECQLKLLL